ncbi:hypothetical protein [Parafrankia sp. BMG5.11]|uniref:hypothetical protein n=1 Tax=Parafrankia sp. BMG5.11 TaxID=222540 RepID=UPI00103B9BCD|nr:hypothetical protein [Parafrankia sp. BMG5.11]TCJ32620.1 hypothetical protein E0504_41635 [Parafrankia sp. BMG5.11]
MSPSPPHPARDTIPPGDLELHDHYLPALPAGDYRIEATHTLRAGPHDGAQVVGGPFTAVQRFTVRGPQVRIDADAVVARQPPDAASGRFAEVLPHVVLGDPMLPWERPLGGASRDTPWLALLVLTDDQLVGGITTPTRTVSATVAEFLAHDAAVLKPALTVESDIGPGDPCVYIQVAAAEFHAVAPRLGELRFLAHCRGANTGDRPILGLQEDGLFSVIVANRFPTAAPPGSDPGTGTKDPSTGTKNIVHLVSLEGHERILADTPDFQGRSSVALLSLCSWSFQAQPDREADFADLAEGLTRTPSGTRAGRDDMWLRLPGPPGQTDTAARRHVARRIDDGYLPLPYLTRSGEATYGWYRGPLTPVLPAATDRAAQATTADALIAYDPAWGSFDLSLAAAFDTGRALALADAPFAQHLLAFKQATRHLVDTLHHQATSVHLQRDGSGRTRPGTARAAFGALLDGHLLTALGTPPGRPRAAWSPPTPAAPSADPAGGLEAVLRSDATRAALATAMDADDGLGEHLTRVADWLGRLLLLHPVPFTHLVPDERMLPRESLRFFHLDPSWLDALLSGALSIGAQSSRDTLQDQVVAVTIRAAAAEKAAGYRATQRGTATDSSPEDPTPEGTAPGAAASGGDAVLGPVSGLLLRSALVSGWPNLAVRALDEAGELLPVLRMDHLSPTVLLCLFEGLPAAVELREPQEGFRFGVEDHGLIPLRNLLAPPPASGGRPLGEQIGPDVTFPVLDHVRAGAGGPILDLGSLIPALTAALDAAHGTAVGPIGPADLALQMVKVPEAIRFTGPNGDRG